MLSFAVWPASLTVPKFPAPDIGTTFDYQGSSYRVDCWLKAMLDQSDITMAMISKKAMEVGELSPDLIDMILASTQRKLGPRNEKLIGCTREEAEYVSGVGVGGCLAPIEEIKITGRVKWPAHIIDECREQALRLVGRPVC